MTTSSHSFDQASISGYLDGELTQGQAQKVRLHLEDCDECRLVADELRTLKEATMTTEFQTPDDTQWDEAPKTAVSGFIRNFGWAIALAWVVGILGYALWQVATEGENPVEAVIVFTFWLGFTLILLSALIDRLRTRKTDPYRKVQK